MARTVRLYSRKARWPEGEVPRQCRHNGYYPPCILDAISWWVIFQLSLPRQKVRKGWYCLHAQLGTNIIEQILDDFPCPSNRLKNYRLTINVKELGPRHHRRFERSYIVISAMRLDAPQHTKEGYYQNINHSGTSFLDRKLKHLLCSSTVIVAIHISTGLQSPVLAGMQEANPLMRLQLLIDIKFTGNDSRPAWVKAVACPQNRIP